MNEYTHHWTKQHCGNLEEMYQRRSLLHSSGLWSSLCKISDPEASQSRPSGARTLQWGGQALSVLPHCHHLWLRARLATRVLRDLHSQNFILLPTKQFLLLHCHIRFNSILRYKMNIYYCTSRTLKYRSNDSPTFILLPFPRVVMAVILSV